MRFYVHPERTKMCNCQLITMTTGWSHFQAQSCREEIGGKRKDLDRWSQSGYTENISGQSQQEVLYWPKPPYCQARFACIRLPFSVCVWEIPAQISEGIRTLWVLISLLVMWACHGDRVAYVSWISLYCSHLVPWPALWKQVGRMPLRPLGYSVSNAHSDPCPKWIILRDADILLISTRLMLYSRCLSSMLCESWCWSSHKYLPGTSLPVEFLQMTGNTALGFVFPGVSCPNRKVYIHYNLKSNLKNHFLAQDFTLTWIISWSVAEFCEKFTMLPGSWGTGRSCLSLFGGNASF